MFFPSISLLAAAAAAAAQPSLPSYDVLRAVSAARTQRSSQPAAPLRPSSPAVDNFRFLDNGVIRLGIDTTRGGTIGWLGPSSDPALSLLNVHDYGRSVQGSFYSGPAVFNPEGKCSEPGGWGRPWRVPDFFPGLSSPLSLPSFSPRLPPPRLPPAQAMEPYRRRVFARCAHPKFNRVRRQHDRERVDAAAAVGLRQRALRLHL